MPYRSAEQGSVVTSVAMPLRFDYAEVKRGSISEDAFNAAVLAAMDKDGVLIIDNAVSAEDCDTVVSEMRPFIDATPPGVGTGGGDQTRRIGAVPARSPSSHKLIAHPGVLAVCASVLGEQRLAGRKVQLAHDGGANETLSPVKQNGISYPWQLHLTQVIDIGPGQMAQPVHRDNWAFMHDFGATEIEISTIWALTEFTEENGATRVIPGSHRWDESKLTGSPKIEETSFAGMPKGSVLIWLGSTYHAGGTNTTNDRRIALNLDYNLAILRQEENQYLDNPPHVARNYSPEMQRLIGYTKAGGAMGYLDGGLDTEEALKGFDPTVPGGGYTSRL